MSKPKNSKEKPAKSLQQLLFGRLPLEHETVMFLVVNVLDFLLTYRLMAFGSASGHRVVESNPVARYFLDHWGPVKGMLMFKLGIVVFVCIISQIVAMRRLETARWLLRISTLIVTFVLFYSVILFFRH